MPARRLIRRLSVYGDLLTRLLNWGTRHCPPWLEPIFLGPWSAVFLALCPKQRRAVAGNLGAVFPEWGWLRRQLGAYRVIYSFGATLVDAARAADGQDCIDWDIEGGANFAALSGSDGGGIVLTAHMGNYDLAAPVFAERFGRRLNAVRAPEREAELQAHYERRRAATEGAAFAVRYNRGGGMLGAELMALLAAGELVALQGDRVLFDVAPGEGVLCGRRARLPKGPFALAAAARVPIWPLFIVRDGWRRYRIRVGEAFEVRGARGEREAAMDAGMARWCAELEVAVRGWPLQWFVFEPVFGGAGEVGGRAARAPGEAAPAVRARHRGDGRWVAALAASFVPALFAAAFWPLAGMWGWAGAALLAAPVGFVGLHGLGFAGAAIGEGLQRTGLLPGRWRAAFLGVVIAGGVLAADVLGIARGHGVAWAAAPFAMIAGAALILQRGRRGR